MNNTYNLSQSERVYLGRVGTTKTITLTSKATEPRPAKRVTSNAKGAGRKRLEEPVKAERIEQRRDAVVNQRKRLDETRRDRKQSKQEFEQQRREKMKVVLSDREKLQALQNKPQIFKWDDVNTPIDLPEGCSVVGGLFAQRGKTAIRINAKTIIYVKHGYSILDAIEKHLLHQKLQLAI
jgi:hypothetical protein